MAMPLLTPADPPYNNFVAGFMVTEVQKHDDFRMKNRPDDQKVITMGIQGNFLRKPINLSVTGLQGCHVYGVISEAGCWMIHVWEDPSLQQGAAFIKDVYEIIMKGDDGDDRRDPSGQPYITCLKNLVKKGEMFESCRKPEIFTLIMGNPHVVETSTRSYPRQAGQAAMWMQDILGPNTPIRKLGYTPYPLDQAAPPNQTAKGKFLIQYTPAQTINPQVAKVSIYVTDRGVDEYNRQWPAQADQIIP